MQDEYKKTLWMLRFEKMKRNEDEAARKYQEILKECRPLKDEKVCAWLKQLATEEKAHSKLMEELIEICRRTHPESDPF